MKYQIISTGSKGNAVVLNEYILMDCGVSFKALSHVLRDLRLVLLTHVHSDHVKVPTVKKLAKERPTLRFGCHKSLAEKLIEEGVSSLSIDVMESGKKYDYGVFQISPIKLYHDVPNFGYRIYSNGQKVLYATDTGHMEGITAKDYDLYLIEANYSEDELKERIEKKMAEGEFCYELNVADRHLSQEQASEWLMANMGERSKHVFLHMHEEKEEKT